MWRCGGASVTVVVVLYALEYLYGTIKIIWMLCMYYKHSPVMKPGRSEVLVITIAVLIPPVYISIY